MKDKGDNKTVFGLPTVDRTEQNAATVTKMVQQIMDARPEYHHRGLHGAENHLRH